MSFLTATTLISAHGARILWLLAPDLPSHKQVNLNKRLTKCQACLMYYCSWPLDAWGGVTEEVTGWQVHLTKHQPDPQADQMSC